MFNKRNAKRNEREEKIKLVAVYDGKGTGVEIKGEGDIVNCKTTGYHFNGFAVEWCQEQCRFVIANDNNSEIRSFAMDENFEYEVIGNIHDNPELLGGDAE